MKLGYRSSKKIGIFRFNFTRNGLSSITAKLGPASWNTRRDGTRIDLPGGLHATTRTGPKFATRRRARRAARRTEER